MTRRKPHPTPTEAEAKAKVTRGQELLRKCAEDLMDCRAPLSNEFLIANNVTADECFGLSETMGVILKGYLIASKEIQNMVLLLGATDGAIPTDIIEETVRRAGLLKELKALRAET
jgi:hypothetical protein